MMTFLKNNKRHILYVLPTLLLCLYFLKSSYSQPLHDFSNSYFSARLLHEGVAAETVIFDIYKFNSYIWELGYKGELVDFYVNSPFTLAVFYPLAYIKNAYLAKAIFNGFSIICFLWTLFLLARNHLKKDAWLLLFIPLLFYVPIRNQILFGQSYFIVLFLVVLGFSFLRKKQSQWGSGLLSLAILLKFFPVFYGIPLLAQKRWKAILWGVFLTGILCCLGIAITGPELWRHYFFDVLPHTMQSKTATDYRFTYQSLDVFFKTIFIQDAYYNPEAWQSNDRMYLIANWVTKAIILGSAVYATLQKKRDLFMVLAIWVTAMFILQSRTATYAQILWVIPLLALYKLEVSNKLKIGFAVVLLLICNLPFHQLRLFPVAVQFSRLWLVLLLVVLFYWGSVRKFSGKYVLIAFVLLLPLNLGITGTTNQDDSQYVLDKKQHFMIYDFSKENEKLVYHAIGRAGAESLATNIEVNTFDESVIIIKNHQLFFGDRQLTHNRSLKKKPVLVNGCLVYFLTDHHSRRAAFTIKVIDICENLNSTL